MTWQMSHKYFYMWEQIAAVETVKNILKAELHLNGKFSEKIYYFKEKCEIMK